MSLTSRARKQAEREAAKLIKLERDYRDLQKLRELVKKRESWWRRFLDEVATAEEY